MRHVVGLDVSTTAVRAVQLGRHRRRIVVRRVAEVALPPGVVIAGEVVDAAAVATALRRLWREGHFDTHDVVVGIANARAVIRGAELPAMPESELRSALPFQVSELIPWPVDDAQLDYQVIGQVAGADGEDRLRVLLVAAQLEMLRSLLAALDGAGLRPRRIDLVPFALVEALASGLSGQSEAIVEVGSGVTNVVVHEDGAIRFARTTTTSTATVADVRREPVVAAAVAATTGWVTDGDDLLGFLHPPAARIDPVVTEIIDSLDYHLAQPGTPPLGRIVVVGGGSGETSLRAGIAEHSGVAVVEGDPLAGVSLRRSRHAFESMAEAADRFAPAIGLALGELRGQADRRRINLVPREVAVRRTQRRQLLAGIVALAVLVVGLLGLAFERRVAVDRARADAVAVERQVADLETQVGTLGAIAAEQVDVARRRQLLATSLAGDIAWPRLFTDVSASLPGDVWLTTFSATRGDGATPGSITITAKGVDQASPARFLGRVVGFPSLDGAWVSSSSRDASGDGRGLVTFNATAKVTSHAESGRASTIGVPR